MPFSGDGKPTPRSVRIISMQDSNEASATTHTGVGSSGRAGAGAGGHRELGTDRKTTTRVSSNASAPPLLFLPYSLSFSSRPRVLWSLATKASAIGAFSPTLISFSQTPDARLRAAILALPKFRSPGLHLKLLRDPSWKIRIHFYMFPFSFSFSRTCPFRRSSTFNAIYVML